MNHNEDDHHGKSLLTSKEIDYDHRLFISFSFVTLSFFFLFIALQIPAKLYQQTQENKSSSRSTTYNVLIEQTQKDHEELDKKFKKYLSNKNQMAQGNLTKEKFFENLSENDEFETSFENFSARILKGYKPSSLTLWQSKKSILPSHYKFRRKFAFSWDRFGTPLIPTIKFKHFEYFQAMLRKIRMHWAPPGGIPSPVYDDHYFSSFSYGGTMRLQSIRPQDVEVVFALDKEGKVLGARIHNSLGDKHLDAACIDAILSSKTFGPPDKELLEDGIAQVSLVFRVGFY